jgi:hypothetical protein
MAAFLLRRCLPARHRRPLVLVNTFTDYSVAHELFSLCDKVAQARCEGITDNRLADAIARAEQGLVVMPISAVA